MTKYYKQTVSRVIFKYENNIMYYFNYFRREWIVCDFQIMINRREITQSEAFLEIL